jgi:hypothetical protein
VVDASPVSRYLLVRCQPGLDESRITGLFHVFALTPGVRCVFDADVTGLSRDALDVITGRPIDEPRPRRAPKVKLA